MTFETMQLPNEPTIIAPDGSDVRVLLQGVAGGMAHFELGAGLASTAIAHRSVEEIWFILEGLGEMWRKFQDNESTVPLQSGTCVSIPVGTHFQFRASNNGPLSAIGVTMPPWPGAEEASIVKGVWQTTDALTEQ